jgi:hypothetical protein
MGWVVWYETYHYSFVTSKQCTQKNISPLWVEFYDIKHLIMINEYMLLQVKYVAFTFVTSKQST